MRVLLGFLYLLYSVACWSQSNPPAPTPPETGAKAESSAKNNHTDAKRNDAQPAAAAVMSVPAAPLKHVANDDKQQHRDYTSHEWWLVWLTGGLVIVTGILAGYTACLWGSTKALANDSKESAERQMRAYISNLQVRCSPFTDAAPHRIELLFKNFGQTPAYNVSIWSRVEEMSVEAATTFDFPMEEPTPQSATWGPGQEVHMPLPLIFKNGPYVQDGSFVRFAFGQGNYKDAFGKRRNFRFRYAQGGPIYGVRDGYFVTCFEGNDAD